MLGIIKGIIKINNRRLTSLPFSNTFILSECLTLKQKKKERKKETVLLPDTREFRVSIW